MTDSSGPHSTMKRREFLSVGAAAIGAAGLGGTAVEASVRTPIRTARDTVRIGIIGAGDNVREVMIPAFRRIPECQLVAVANRSLASSQRVATQYDIPRAYDHWRELLADPEVDAVVIGTWPYMHRVLTLAALEAGKHVLCQSRMANDAQEAREMLEASRRHPDLVAHLVLGSPRPFLARMLGDGYLGELHSAEVLRLGGAAAPGGFANPAAEQAWSDNFVYNGFNAPLGLGSTYEGMSRLLGRATRVMAMSKVHMPRKRTSTGELVTSVMPDHVDILYELANGAQVHMKVSNTTGLGHGNDTWLFGSEGTIRLDGQRILAAKRGESELREITEPAGERPSRRVEAEFVHTIRGVEQPAVESFEIGLHYMEFSEAVHRSARSGAAVTLPL